LVLSAADAIVDGRGFTNFGNGFANSSISLWNKESEWQGVWFDGERAWSWGAMMRVLSLISRKYLLKR